MFEAFNKIQEDSAAASITETINSRLPIAKAKSEEILKISNDPQLIGFPSAIGPINDYESKVASKILNNADSWIGLNDSHIKTLQDFQDEFIMKVFQVSPRGTPKSMLWLDSQMLKMKWRIIQLKITMGKSDDNLCNCRKGNLQRGRPPYRMYEHM